jgi:hypothetical protein
MGLEVRKVTRGMQLETERKVARTKYGKIRLGSIDELDGRTAAAKKAQALVAGLVADLGADPSTGQRQLVTRAALLAAIIEDMEARWIGGEQIDFSEYTLLVNAQRRLLATVGLERRARDVTPPTIEEYARHVRERAREGAPA